MDKHRFVTVASTCRTFQFGDRIVFNEDGSISCAEAGGWISAEDVGQATLGMHTEVDQQWVARRRALLLDELKMLEAN